MNSKGKIYLCFSICLLLLVGSMQLWSQTLNHADATSGQQLVFKLSRILKQATGFNRVEVSAFQVKWRWTRLQLKLYDDEEYPIVLDIVGSNFKVPKKIIYLLHGTNLNFRSSFFTPDNKNMTHFFRKKGYLVMGITQREDSVPETGPFNIMEGWGLAKHKADIRKVITVVLKAVNMKYDILGHSMGAVYALDYAASYDDKLDKIILLDIDSFSPETEPEKIYFAGLQSDAYQQVMNQGIYADTTITDFRVLAQTALAYPDLDSGESREFLGLPGNFTIGGLFHFATIYSGSTPGVTTPYTGLPEQWSLVQGNLAGSYQFDLDPLADQYGFTHCTLEFLVEAALRCGGGTFPLASLRDFTAMLSFNYPIDWTGVREKVVYVNMELGFGNQTYWAELIKQNGNANVRVNVVPGYAHADCLWGQNAENDVWPLLVD